MRMAGHGSRESTRDFEAIAREIVAEARATDEAEDELYGDEPGDELPEQLRTRAEFFRHARERRTAESPEAQPLEPDPESVPGEAGFEFDTERIRSSATVWAGTRPPHPRRHAPRAAAPGAARRRSRPSGSAPRTGRWRSARSNSATNGGGTPRGASFGARRSRRWRGDDAGQVATKAGLARPTVSCTLATRDAVQKADRGDRLTAVA
jgi:hypothetical protein